MYSKIEEAISEYDGNNFEEVLEILEKVEVSEDVEKIVSLLKFSSLTLLCKNSPASLKPKRFNRPRDISVDEVLLLLFSYQYEGIDCGSVKGALYKISKTD